MQANLNNTCDNNTCEIFKMNELDIDVKEFNFDFEPQIMITWVLKVVEKIVNKCIFEFVCKNYDMCVDDVFNKFVEKKCVAKKLKCLNLK